MSTYTTIGTASLAPSDPERGHRTRVLIACILAIALVAAVIAYGFDYYTLGAADRPFSPKHSALRPSGQIGVRLGILGFAIFAGLFVYPLRKNIAWLGKLGKARHWLDFHIILGLTAPVIIACHASFKFKGIAGMAFWIMVAVALSGIAGRYIYAQIPRSLASTELSLKELEKIEGELTEQLTRQHLVLPAELEPLFRVPTREQIGRESAVGAIFEMLFIDLTRPIKVARLRLRHIQTSEALITLCGLLRTRNADLEAVVRTARKKSNLAKRVAFLARTQQIFHLWHVVHRPFSYSFAVLALVHVTVALMFGFL